jgi:hypothetical protein
MNSKLLTICLLAAPLSVCAQQPSGQGEDVTLQVSIINPDGILGPGPKGPVQAPYVTLDDHTLYIWSQHNGYVLTLYDDNDTVVYQTYVNAGVQYDVLPATLSGSYTLILSDDTYLYTGVIDLE